MSKIEDEWQALGFKRKPFIELSRTNPFLTTKQRQQLNLLEELVREGGHLLLLLGVSGVGKTTFLSALKKNIALPTTEATIGLCEMHGDPGVTVAMIIGLLAKHLALDDTADNFMSTLRPRLVQLAQSNQRFLLIIDDAHELPAETVRFILDVVSELDEAEHSLSILLAGRLQLEHLCINSDWNTGSSFTVVLQPLSEEEIVNYIKHGLRQANYRGVMPFSKAQLIELSRDSKGILARLVVMAVDILETKRRGVAPQRQMPRLIKKMQAILGYADEPATARVTTQRTAKRDNTAEKRSVKDDDKKFGYKGVLAAALSIALFGVGWWIYLGGPTPTAIDVSQGKVISVEKDGQWVKTVVKPAMNIAAAPVTAVVDTTAAAVPVTPVVEDVPITTPIANDALGSEPPVAVAAAKPAVSITSASVTAQKKAAPAVPFKAQGYTIQIAGGSDLISLQKTVCQLWLQQAKPSCSGLPASLHYIHTQKDNQDWYIATMGQYNSSAAARAQLQQLPAKVQKNTPWVRSFAQIPNLTVVAAR